MSDLAWPIILNDGEWPEGSALLQWTQFMDEAFTKMGRRADCARLYKDQLVAAGFVNVVEKRFIWPTNSWPKDKKLKELGMWCREDFQMGLEAMSMGLFTRVLGWTSLDVEVFIVKAKNEFNDPRIHAYYEV